MATTKAPNISIPAELKKRILFTLGMLAIYRIGVAVPTPGVNADAVMQFFQSQSAGLFGLFNTFTGGALERFSVFALGIMPYISASIIFQLLQASIPHFEQLKKEGESGRKKLTQYTRYATVLLSIVQGYGMATWLAGSNSNGVPLVTWTGPIPFTLLTIFTLTAGACFIMWLGEQITERGVGNGASLIIFAGIAAGIPGGAMSLWNQVSQGELNFLMALLIIAGIILVIAGIIFIETGQRRITVQYSQKGQGRQALQAPQSHLPLKINFANVIPPIFASSLLMFPATVVQFVDTPWMQSLANEFTPTGSLYHVIFTALVVFFCFFYTEIVFNPTEVADNLKKYGGFIPGVRAGNSTAAYIKRVLDRLTVTGAIYLSAICIVPTLLSDAIPGVPLINGTSLLILVGVALDTSQQIQSYLLTAKYDGVMSGMKVRSRRVQY